jgi:hypothetical protein
MQSGKMLRHAVCGQSIVKALNKLLNAEDDFVANLTKGDPRSGFP